jgi:probable HAF family extracellular repeat protein
MAKPRWRSLVAVWALVGGAGVVGAAPAAAGAQSRPPAPYRLVDLGPGMTVGDINESAMAIGSQEVGGTPTRYRAFVWFRGRVSYVSGLGGAETNLVDINNLGHIAGVGQDVAGAWHGFLLRDGRTVDLGSLGGGGTVPRALNDRDEVVGYSRLRSGELRAFLWRAGRMTDLGTLGGRSSSAAAIDNAGRVAGNSTVRSGRQHGFVWRAGRMTDVGNLGAEYTFVTQINAQGHVFGLSLLPVPTDHWFLWRDGRITDTGIDEDQGAWLTDSDLVVGTHLGDGGWRAMTWFHGVTRDLPRLPGDGSNHASRANLLGQITGYAEWDYQPDGTSRVRAELWHRGAVTALPAPGYAYSTSYLITDHGVITGEGFNPGEPRHALIWFPTFPRPAGTLAPA